MIQVQAWKIGLVYDLFMALCNDFPDRRRWLHCEILGNGFAVIRFEGTAPDETLRGEFWIRHNIDVKKWMQIIRYRSSSEWKPFVLDSGRNKLDVADMGWLFNESVVMGDEKLEKEQNEFREKLLKGVVEKLNIHGMQG